jgi:hypothetical protein
MLREKGMRISLIALLSLTLLAHAKAADLAFHLSEDVVEDEVRPRHAHHETHWEGDYYVSDKAVTASGWGRKPADIRAVPFDTPVRSVNPWGSALTTTFHRNAQSLDVTIEYDSFVVERHVEMTGPQSCTDDVTSWLKPGHDLFEVHRRSNREPMFDSWRHYTNTRCRPPALSS